MAAASRTVGWAASTCCGGQGLTPGIGFGQDEASMRMIRSLGLLVAGVCALLFGAIAVGPLPQAAAASQQVPSARLAWKGCGKRLQCARVGVPLNWSRPRGSQISLAVIRYRATGPGRRIGSMFVNPGGPGGSVDQVKRDGAMLD